MVNKLRKKIESKQAIIGVIGLGYVGLPLVREFTRGGATVIGFDVDPRGSKLIVNEEEAARVRVAFELYLEHERLLPVVEELDHRGWRNKEWTTRKGTRRGGRRFDKNSLWHLFREIKKVNPCIINAIKIRQSVITYWLKTINLRQVQYMAGHKYVSSTERYQTNYLDNLQSKLEKCHPLSRRN